MTTTPTALEAFESQDSQSFKVTAAAGGDAMTLKAMVTGTDDRAIAYGQILAYLNNVLVLPPGHLVVADSISMSLVGNEIWEATIEYVSPENTETQKQPKSIGEVTFEFDGTGGQTRIFEGFEQRKYGIDAPDFKKAIDLDAENKPKGIDVIIPQVAFSLHQRFEGATINLPWLRTIIFKTGCVNSDTFLGFAPGELLFLGPSGQQPLAFMNDGTVARGERDITFRFAASPNVTGLEIDGITGIAKGGHEYLWIKYKPEIASGDFRNKALGVYVATVYRPTAFAGLGISDPDVSYPVAGA